MNLNPVVLLVEDKNARTDNARGSNRSLAQKNFGFELRPKKDVRSAYWEFLRLGPRCLAAIIDLQLQNDRLGNYDGIDLVLAFSRLSSELGPESGTERPWLIGYTAESSSAVLGAFNVLRRNAPNILALLRKDVVLQPVEVYDALSRRDWNWFQQHDNPQPVLPGEPATDFHWKPGGSGAVRILDGDGALRFSEAADRIVDGNALLGGVCKQVFASYREVSVKPLPPGYSGALVVQIAANRMSASRSRTRGKLFLVKIRPISLSAPEKSLRTEKVNFLAHAPKIKEHSPLLFGYFDDLVLDGVRYEYVVYELIDFLSNSTWTYHQQLESAVTSIKDKQPAEERLQRNIFEQDSYQYAKALFQSLANWHDEKLPKLPPVKSCYSPVQLGDIKDKIKQHLPGFDPTDDFFPLSYLNIARDLSLRNPLPLAEGILEEHYPKLSFSRSTIHGDLHSTNVLRQRPPAGHSAVNPHWMIIDFEDVNPGHIAMDVATMECDLKFRWIDEKHRGDLVTRYKLELELAEHLLPTPNILAVSQKLVEEQGSSTLSLPLRLLVVQLVQLRKAAFDRNWPYQTRQALMEVSIGLLFKSLQHCLWAEKHLDFYPIWFAACVAATGLEESYKAQHSWSA
jgi:hypothetical protein